MVDDPTRRLRRLDCCAVSDAMEKLGLKDQVASGLEQRSTTRRIAGRVVTYRVVPANEAPTLPAGAAPRHLGTTAIALHAANARKGIDM